MYLKVLFICNFDAIPESVFWYWYDLILSVLYIPGQLKTWWIWLNWIKLSTRHTFCFKHVHIRKMPRNKHMLYIGRWRNMAAEIFKTLHGSTPIYIRDLFEEKDKIYNLCSTVSLKQPKCNTVTYVLNSFRL